MKFGVEIPTIFTYFIQGGKNLIDVNVLPIFEVTLGSGKIYTFKVARSIGSFTIS
jgi:hypothetical protein